MLARTAENGGALAEIAPWVEALPLPDEGEEMYLCRDGVCAPAVGSVAELRELILY